MEYPLPAGEVERLSRAGLAVRLRPLAPAWYRAYLEAFAPAAAAGADWQTDGRRADVDELVLWVLARLGRASGGEVYAQLPAPGGRRPEGRRSLYYRLARLAFAGLVDRDRDGFSLSPEGRRLLGLPAGGGWGAERQAGGRTHRRLCRLGAARAVAGLGFVPLVAWSMPDLGPGLGRPDALVVGDAGGAEAVVLVEVELHLPKAGEPERVFRRLGELRRLRLGRPGILLYLVRPRWADAYRRLLPQQEGGIRVEVVPWR